MRTRLIHLALFAGFAVPAIAVAQSNPCAEHTCNIVYDWGNGGTSPDVDRRYGAPSELEANLTGGLASAGWRFASSGQTSSMTITVRISPQNKALCDTMPGVNPDYTCHTVSRAAIVFTPNDSTQKPISRIDVNPRCSDPKNYPTFAQFGKFAAETLIYTIVNEGKGQRPNVKCQ